MSHVAEGSLQAYLDGEIDGTVEAALREHLGACAACAGELDSLRHAGRVTHAALSLLDVPAPALRARAALAAARPARRTQPRLAWLGAGGFAKAAMLLLALAGVGAAAIPDSPVRRALEATFERVSQLFAGTDAPQQADAPAVAPTAPAADEAPMGIVSAMPANGRVRIVLHAPTGALAVTVRFGDENRARVLYRVEQGPERTVSGTGRLELVGLGGGEVVIEIPRHVPNATLQVDGEVYVYKEGERLQASGPAGTTQGSEVRFRIGT